MTSTEPVAELDARFSSEGATATPWSEAQARLEGAETFWVTTVRPDGRPHVTPLIAVWHEDSLFFCTGPDERKAQNLAANAHCTLTTGCDKLHEGLDLVVEGGATRVTDERRLQAVADVYLSKYGEEWRFEVKGDAFSHNDGGVALVFEVRPTTVFGFAKGDYAQTRWRF